MQILGSPLISTIVFLCLMCPAAAYDRIEQHPRYTNQKVNWTNIKIDESANIWINPLEIIKNEIDYQNYIETNTGEAFLCQKNEEEFLLLTSYTKFRVLAFVDGKLRTRDTPMMMLPTNLSGNSMIENTLYATYFGASTNSWLFKGIRSPNEPNNEVEYIEINDKTGNLSLKERESYYTRKCKKLIDSKSIYRFADTEKIYPIISTYLASFYEKCKLTRKNTPLRKPRSNTEEALSMIAC